jgi:hypothetical protein
MDILTELAGRIEAGIEEAAARQYCALRNAVQDALQEAPLQAGEVEQILALLEPARARMVASVRERTIRKAVSDLNLSVFALPAGLAS